MKWEKSYTESFVHETLSNTVAYGNESHKSCVTWKRKLRINWNFRNISAFLVYIFNNSCHKIMLLESVNTSLSMFESLRVWRNFFDEKREWNYVFYAHQIQNFLSHGGATPGGVLPLKRVTWMCDGKAPLFSLPQPLHKVSTFFSFIRPYFNQNHTTFQNFPFKKLILQIFSS